MVLDIHFQLTKGSRCFRVCNLVGEAINIFSLFIVAIQFIYSC